MRLILARASNPCLPASRPSGDDPRGWRRASLERLAEIPTPLPRHLAICMDGNRRWAVRHGVALQSAYVKAERVAEDVIASCEEIGIPALTLFAFSHENWNRDPLQVTLLLTLLQSKIERSWKKWNQMNRRVQFIGDFARFSSEMVKLLSEVERETKGNDGLRVTVALSYGGRQDLLQSFREVAEKVQRGEKGPDEITERDLESSLQSAKAFGTIGSPDLFVRTSGEKRLSNFMLWDMAYTELHFESALWPDFGPQEFLTALQDYSLRQRRFGR